MIEVADFLRHFSWYDKVSPYIHSVTVLVYQGSRQTALLFQTYGSHVGKDVISLRKVASEMLLLAGPRTSSSKFEKG